MVKREAVELYCGCVLDYVPGTHPVPSVSLVRQCSESAELSQLFTRAMECDEVDSAEYYSELQTNHLEKGLLDRRKGA